MLRLTCCQDHILTENIWFVWSETSFCGDERRCNRCGTNEQTVKIELLSQWKLEAEFRNYKYNTIFCFCGGLLKQLFSFAWQSWWESRDLMSEASPTASSILGSITLLWKSRRSSMLPSIWRTLHFPDVSFLSWQKLNSLLWRDCEGDISFTGGCNCLHLWQDNALQGWYEMSLLFGKGWSWVIARNGPEGHNWPGEPNCQYDPQEATSPKSGLVTDHSATTPVVKLIKIKEEDGDWRSCACFGKLCHIFGLNMYTASIQLYGYIAYSYMAFFGLILTTNLCLFWQNFDFLIFQDQVWTR